MDNCLQNSLFVRCLQAIGRKLHAICAGSRTIHTLRSCWQTSKTKARAVQSLQAPAAATEHSKLFANAQTANKKAAKNVCIKNCWNNSLLGKFCHSITRALRKSRLLGWLFCDGVHGVLIFAVGVYVLIDYLLRDILQVPVISSVWDELLLLFALFWLVWQRLGRKNPIEARTNPLDIPVLLFLSVGFFLMCIVSPYAHIQLDGYRATMQYLLWFFVITRLLESDRDFMRLYLALCGLALAIALHGIYQYIIDVPMPEKWVAQAETAVRTRVYSIFGSPNIMGDFMVLFVPMTVALAYHTDKKPLQLLAWLSAIILCVACLFTMSRGAWVAMAAAIVLFILFVDRKLFWLLLAGCVVLVFIPFVRTRIGFLFTEDFVAANTNGGRAGRWENGLALLDTANRLTGLGLGMFGGAVAMQNQVLDGVEYFYLDNYYLKIFVEMGWLGIGSFLFMLFAMLSASVRTLRRTFVQAKSEPRPVYPLCAGMLCGLIGVLIHCFFENIFEEPYMMVYFWVIAAMIVWCGFLRKPTANAD